jgi:hypothetical protein
MLRDHLGCPVSAADATSIRILDDFVGGLLAYETRAEAVVAGADRNPECTLLNVYAGYLWMLLEAPEAPERAAKYLHAAERGYSTVTLREQLNIALLQAWVADDVAAALGICARISAEFPRDLTVVKLHQYLEFNRGNAPAMLRVALQVLEPNADVAYAHGMAAFAFEQCPLPGEAADAARTALKLKRKEPWAQHALAHVFLTRGQVDAGAGFLEGLQDTWTGLNSFMSTHLWWHLALFYLSQGRGARVLELYDRHCWGISKSYSQDQIGAVSLLARIEFAGVDVAGRWQELAVHLAARANDTVQPFLTLQYLYGLAKAGRPEAGTLLQSVRRQAQTAPPFTRAAWAGAALPAAEGLWAHANRDYDAAWERLGVALPRLAAIGGSHAQRDLFAQVMLDAALKSGRWTEAQQLLEARRAADPDGVPVNQTLAAVYVQLGLPAIAAHAQARADATRARHHIAAK